MSIFTQATIALIYCRFGYDYLGSVGAVLYKRNNGGSNGPLNDWDYK
jgi:hypothetical protein